MNVRLIGSGVALRSGIMTVRVTVRMAMGVPAAVRMRVASVVRVVPVVRVGRIAAGVDMDDPRRDYRAGQRRCQQQPRDPRTSEKKSSQGHNAARKAGQFRSVTSIHSRIVAREPDAPNGPITTGQAKRDSSPIRPRQPRVSRLPEGRSGET